MDSALPAIDDRKNASFSLKGSFNGDMSVSKSNDSTIQYDTTNKDQNVTTEYMYHGYTVTGDGTNITSATGTLFSTIVEDSITKITYSLFSESSSTTIYKKTSVTENGSTTNTTTSYVDGEETTLDWPIDLPWSTLPVKDMATMYVYYVNGKAVTITVESVFEEDYNQADGTHYYKLTGYKVSTSNDVDIEVVMTKLTGTKLTIQLKTGDGDTLELNKAVTIAKNA